MSKFDSVRTRSQGVFLRDVGISLETFLDILAKVRTYIEVEKERHSLKRRGRKSKKLSLEDKLLLTFYYLRHYSTFIKLGIEFGISESYANKIYHQMMKILVRVLDMSDPKELLDSDTKTAIIDVTEQPIERPKKRQKAYYSGKKLRHTIKVQLVVCLLSLRILSVICQKGRVHDFRILKESRLAIHPDIVKYADSGYQGIHKIYQNSHTPIKKTKKKQLSDADKKHNRELSKKKDIR